MQYSLDNYNMTPLDNVQWHIPSLLHQTRMKNPLVYKGLSAFFFFDDYVTHNYPLSGFSGDTLLEHRNTSIGNIASGEILVPAKADDNGATYRCTATNKATEVPLEAKRNLTVHCKFHGP